MSTMLSFPQPFKTGGLCDNTITHRIQILQNTAIRLMTFQEPRASVTPTYAELKILKFFDLVETLNINLLTAAVGICRHWLSGIFPSTLSNYRSV